MLKCHVIPLSFRPDPPSQASSSLSKAYRVAKSPLVYDVEALGIEALNRDAWGKIGRETAINGKSGTEWKAWIEGQALRERDEGLSGNDGRQKAIGQAMTIVNELESNGYPVLAGLAPPTSINTQDPFTAASQPTASQADIKRGRKRFTEALDDPLIGPALKKLNLSEVCRALVRPLPDRQQSSPEPQKILWVNTKKFESQVVETGSKRKRVEDDDQDMGDRSVEHDFVSPLTGPLMNTSDIRDEEDQMDEDGKEPWHLVTGKRKGRNKGGEDYEMRSDVDGRPGPQEWLSDRVIKNYHRKKRRT